VIRLDLRALLALSYLDGLHRKAAEEAARRPPESVRLDAPDRAPFVRLRGARG
jgi:hypothetical protein